jgi:predicted phage-related endonuclease
MFPFGRARFEVFEVDADPAHQRHLAELADTFWHGHVLTGLAPPADEHTATTRAIAAAWGNLETVTVPTVDFTDQRNLVATYATLKRDEAIVGKQVKACQNLIKAVFGEAAGAAEHGPSEGTIDGQLVISWRSQGRTDLDAAAVRADHGDRYDRHTTIRVLRLHETRPR